jgi:Uma2 family endonuclease
MPTIHEINLPETKPETEWLRGRAVQKPMPAYSHAALQLEIGTRLRRWANGRGRAGSEWRFRVLHEGLIRPLVPDVAYLSYESLGRESVDEAQVPLGAPDVAIEILSPTDEKADIEHKIAVYLSAGTALVLIVDAKLERFIAHDCTGSRGFEIDEIFVHGALPDLTINLTELFQAARE